MKTQDAPRKTTLYYLVCISTQAEIDYRDVRNAAGNILDVDSQELDQLFRQLPVTVKRNITHAVAKRLQLKLYEIGIEAMVIPEDNQATPLENHFHPGHFRTPRPSKKVVHLVWGVMAAASLVFFLVFVVPKTFEIAPATSSIEDSVFRIAGTYLYGTGFLVNDLIFTAYHVIDGEFHSDLILSNASATLRPDELRLIFVDKKHDIAIFRVAQNKPRGTSRLIEEQIVPRSESLTIFGYPAFSSMPDPSTVKNSIRPTFPPEGSLHLELARGIDAGFSGGPIYGSEGNIMGMAVKKKPDRDALSWDVLVAAHESGPGQWRDPNETRYMLSSSVLHDLLEHVSGIPEHESLRVEATHNANVIATRLLIFFAKYNSFYKGLLDTVRGASDPASEIRRFGARLQLAEAHFDYLKVDEGMIAWVENNHFVDRHLRLLVRDSWEHHISRKAAWMSNSLDTIAEFEERRPNAANYVERLGEWLK